MFIDLNCFLRWAMWPMGLLLILIQSIQWTYLCFRALWCPWVWWLCFSQDFHEEHALQAFRRRDKGDTGYINAKDFEEIMCKLKSYLLTPFVKENLVTVSYQQLCTVKSSLFLGGGSIVVGFMGSSYPIKRITK